MEIAWWYHHKGGAPPGRLSRLGALTLLFDIRSTGIAAASNDRLAPWREQVDKLIEILADIFKTTRRIARAQIRIFRDPETDDEPLTNEDA